MNHKWENNKCARCGIKRIKRTWKLLMCIVNHPPWEVYKYGKSFFYYGNGIDGTFKRPDCKNITK